MACCLHSVGVANKWAGKVILFRGITLFSPIHFISYKMAQSIVSSYEHYMKKYPVLPKPHWTLTTFSMLKSSILENNVYSLLNKLRGWRWSICRLCAGIDFKVIILLCNSVRKGELLLNSELHPSPPGALPVDRLVSNPILESVVYAGSIHMQYTVYTVYLLV